MRSIRMQYTIKVIALLLAAICLCTNLCIYGKAATRNINISTIEGNCKKINDYTIKFSGGASKYNDSSTSEYFFVLDVFLKRKSGTSWLVVDDFSITFPKERVEVDGNKTYTSYYNGTFMTSVTAKLYKSSKDTDPEIVNFNTPTVVINCW